MKQMAWLGVVLAVLTAGLMIAAPAAQAVVFDLTSDHCSGGCGTPPFGTVTVVQNGTGVDIDVALAAGYSFVKTGSADFQAFKFNGTGVALTDITVDAHVPALVASAGNFSGDGTGFFGFGINCPSCGNGASDKFTTPISFTVANASVNDLIGGNNLGIVFVADVLAPNGNTGPVDVTGTAVPEPGSLLFFSPLLAFAWILGVRRWKHR